MSKEHAYMQLKYLNLSSALCLLMTWVQGHSDDHDRVPYVHGTDTWFSNSFRCKVVPRGWSQHSFDLRPPCRALLLGTPVAVLASSAVGCTSSVPVPASVVGCTSRASVLVRVEVEGPSSPRCFQPGLEIHVVYRIVQPEFIKYMFNLQCQCLLCPGDVRRQVAGGCFTNGIPALQHNITSRKYRILKITFVVRNQNRNLTNVILWAHVQTFSLNSHKK